MSDSHWINKISKAVAEGKTESQFAVPDGIFLGDLFFITDSHHKIIITLMWDGTRWGHEYDVFEVQKP